MRARWALIIWGIFVVSTLGCLPTPSVRGEIRPAGEGYGRARMVYIPFSGLLQDNVSPVFPVRMVSGLTSHRHHDRPQIPECLTSVLSAWNLMEIGANTTSHSLVPSSYPGRAF